MRQHSDCIQRTFWLYLDAYFGYVKRHILVRLKGTFRLLSWRSLTHALHSAVRRTQYPALRLHACMRACGGVYVSARVCVRASSKIAKQVERAKRLGSLQHFGYW